MSEGRVQFRNHEDVRSLFGVRDKNLRRLRDVLHIEVVLRGDELHLHGEQAQVDLGTEIVSDLRAIIERTGRKVRISDTMKKILEVYEEGSSSTSSSRIKAPVHS